MSDLVQEADNTLHGVVARLEAEIEKLWAELRGKATPAAVTAPVPLTATGTVVLPTT